MINCSQFRSYIIEPVLSKLQIYSKEAEELLVFTCAVESLGGTYIMQVKGPALGIYQMEPSTHHDIWVNYIRTNSRLATLMSMHFDCNRIPDEGRLIYDMFYSTAMARIHYLRVMEALPSSEDKNLIWEYFKQYYNTPKGKAQKDDSIKKYLDFKNK